MIRGKDLTLLNVTYIRPSPKNDFKECFEVIYKSADGNVHFKEEAPLANIYIVKPEHRTYSYTKPQERMERMEKVRVPISKIRTAIANEAGGPWKDLKKKAIQARDFRLLDQVYRWPYAYGCDFQPEYYYMKDWYDQHQIPATGVKLTKAFMDIETDMMDYTIDLDDIPNTAYSPVNLITIILEDTKESHTFVLRPYEPPRGVLSKEEYEKRHALYERQKKAHDELMSDMKGFKARLHREFDGTYGYLTYQIHEYEKEIDLIANAFGLINQRKPNFCMFWNMRFDIQYLYYRIINLGYDPRTIMCHPDFPMEDRRCAFRVDRSTYLLEKQYDYFYCSSYTQFICQMRLYASIRKSQHKLKSVALNAIGDRELKDHKVEYPAAANIVRFPYVDWKLFIQYNIKDVLLQLGIERKTRDTMTYYMRSHSNLTPYNKIFKETHLLRNVREIYFEQQGWVQSNNVNILNTRNNEATAEARFYASQEEEESGGASFKGAIMADPSMNDTVGMEVLGRQTNNIHANAMDYDMGAFYPSIKIASNMDPGTLVYKAAFINDEFISGEFLNRSLNTTYQERDKNNQIRDLDITGEAVNTYVGRNILTFGYNYLGLPTISELAMSVIQELKAAA